jgi:hypothetical protein
MNSFDSNVTKEILASNKFGVTELVNIESLRDAYFEKEKYVIIEQLIKNGDFDSIKQMPENKTPEYLHVIKFTDQRGKAFVVTVYDSDELWQDPQVIEIFEL